MTPPKLARLLTIFLTTSALGCRANDSPGPPAPTEIGVNSANTVTGLGEGELFGDILLNGTPVSDSTWRVTLEAANGATGDRLGPYQSGTMWARPGGHGSGHSAMFEWSDPQTNELCGSLSDYIAGNLNARDNEIHWVSQSQAPSGREMHCIRPGQYTLRVYHGNSLVKTIDIDYVPVRGSGGSWEHIWNASAGVDEQVEVLNYDTLTYMWSDVVVSVETGTPGGADSAVLLVQNAGSSPEASEFTDGGTAGSSSDYFRFSSRSSYTPDTGLGRLLSRLYWDSATGITSRTRFWDSHSNVGVIRVHQFLDATSSRSYVVGLETMRRSEQPLSSFPAVKRSVSITVPSPPPTQLTTVISGPDLLAPNEQVTENWSQAASGGSPSYRYDQWLYYRYPGPEQTVGSGGSYTRAVDPTGGGYVFRLKAYAGDSLSQSAVGRFFVEVVPPDGGGGEIAAGTRQMGVRLADGSCGARPRTGNDRQRWLEWVFNHLSGQVEACSF